MRRRAHTQPRQRRRRPAWRSVGELLATALLASGVACSPATKTPRSADVGDAGAVHDGTADGVKSADTLIDTNQVDIYQAKIDATNDVLSDDATASSACMTWSAPMEVGKVSALDELSGLARSSQGWLWAHNDSGEKEARVLLLDTTAKLKAVLHIPEVTPVDWEDMAAGPCGDDGLKTSRCLWIGDIGDNSHKRSTVSIIRVPEPKHDGVDLPPAGTVTHWTAATSDTLRFRYPSVIGDAPATARPDAEALAVLSDGRLLVATKRDDGRTRLFRVTPDASATQPVTAVLLGELDVRDPPLETGLSLRVTGADAVGDHRLLVRTYFRAWAFDFSVPLNAPAKSLTNALSSAVGVTRIKLVTGFDIQAESIAGDGEGGFWHTSELTDQPLWHVPCGP